MPKGLLRESLLPLLQAQVPGLSSHGSKLVVHGLSRSKACGIFPGQGWNSHLLHWQILNH